MDANGLLHINTADYELEPEVGQSVVALVRTEFGHEEVGETVLLPTT
jgi:hypothetical protein